MHISSSQLPAPGRLFLPGCAIAAGLLAVSSPVIAAPSSARSVKPVPATNRLAATPAMTLRVGKTATFRLPALATFTVEEGGQNIFCEAKDGTLMVKAQNPGSIRLRIEAPGRATEIIRMVLVEPGVEQRAFSQIVERAPLDGAIPERSATVTTASPTSEQAPDANLGALGAVAVPNTVPVSPPSAFSGAGSVPSALSTDLGSDVAAPPAPALPALAPPDIAPPQPLAPVMRTPMASPVVRGTASRAQAPQISPILPAPARRPNANVSYRTTARLPQGVGAGSARQSVTVSQGLARLLSFPTNILAVFFSDPNVMDARAINARTIAVTGVGPGPSTLAVFTARFPGDAIGRANIYRIQTVARGGQGAPSVGDPQIVERAITAALGDPRVRTAVITLPDNSLAARLSGTVRNEAEVQAAVTTASFYVPRVVSSLYADPNSPTLEAVLSAPINSSPEADLQENLRRITGNSSIEIVPLPTGVAFKAEVNSTEEAESLLRVLPTLNQQVIPFIVIRGQANPGYYNATVPLLNGEDRQLTQKLHDVTGIRTVYAVRVASNGLACYGTVHTRGEYDTVRRYMTIMAQSSAPPALQGSSQGGATLRPQGFEGPALPSYDPNAGYLRNLGLQMFVRITDPGQSVIRKVTVETNIVEISRTALKNLGVEYGSVPLQTETTTPGTTATTVVRDGLGNPVIDGNGNVVTQTTGTGGSILRTLGSTSLTPGVLVGGNGFAGSGGFGNIDPFRARLNILVNNGNARVLSRPNVTAVEGASAQITIGGERPVPKAVATQGAVGTQVEFRRFGVIISMRPTVLNDNTILLQIRADVTQPDRTFEINLGGALIPGESVRSVDTTLNVRPGDTVVMGGLMTNDRRQLTSKVPFLGDLPIIGALFKSKRYENNETELAIFMTPRIDSQPIDAEGLETMNRVPSFPSLPSRQESNSILFQDTTRNSG